MSGADALPPYTPPSSVLPVTKHVFSSSHSKRDPLSLVVKLQSNATHSSSQPLFYEGSPIKGKLKLTLPKKLRDVCAIFIYIRGFQRGMLTGVGGSSSHLGEAQDTNFFERTVSLWPSNGARASSGLDAGTHRFHFSESLPTRVDRVPAKRAAAPHRLPPTFMTDTLPLFLMYEIQAIVQRGFFHRDERLVVPFRYLPRTQAATPGDLRRLAYEDGSPLWNPQIDPTGWKTYSVTMQGMLYGKREVTMQCSFSVAAPTSFPRGYPIPFFAQLKSNDEQALDLATALAGISVAFDKTYEVSDSVATPPCSPLDKKFNVARGRIWAINPPGKSAPSRGTRDLQGELIAPNNLVPSFACPAFELAYVITFSVQVTGLQAVGGKKGEPCVVVPVTIATVPAPGPRPRSYAPPLRYGEVQHSSPDAGTARGSSFTFA